jgi:hypothetical protein
LPGAQVHEPSSQVLGKSPCDAQLHWVVVTAPPVCVHRSAAPSDPASLTEPPVPDPPAPVLPPPLVELLDVTAELPLVTLEDGPEVLVVLELVTPAVLLAVVVLELLPQATASATNDIATVRRASE